MWSGSSLDRRPLLSLSLALGPSLSPSLRPLLYFSLAVVVRKPRRWSKMGRSCRIEEVWTYPAWTDRKSPSGSQGVIWRGTHAMLIAFLAVVVAQSYFQVCTGSFGRKRGFWLGCGVASRWLVDDFFISVRCRLHRRTKIWRPAIVCFFAFVAVLKFRLFRLPLCVRRLLNSYVGFLNWILPWPACSSSVKNIHRIFQTSLKQHH